MSSRLLLLAAHHEFLGALRHGARRAADGIGHVVVLHWIVESAGGNRARRAESCPLRRLRLIDLSEDRVHFREARTHLLERVIRQCLAEHFRQRTNDRPILAGITRREHRAQSFLHAAFGVDVGAVFFGVGRTRQDDVGAMRAAVAVMALVDHEGIAEALRIDFVGAESTAQFGLRALGRGGRLIIVGLFGGNFSIPLPMFAFTGCQIVGSVTGSPAEMKEMMDLVTAGKVTPVPTIKRRLDEADATLQELRKGLIMGRAVLVP